MSSDVQPMEVQPTTIKSHVKCKFEFSKYITRNLEEKRFKRDTPFGFKAQDELISIDGKDVRQWSHKEIIKLLKKGQGLFGHVFVLVAARPSGPNFKNVMSSETVSFYEFLL